MKSARDIAIIGGGAAGFFAALSVAEHHPNDRVVIHEASLKLLSKVKVSGGGRCNVTHDCKEVSRLVSYYPRGSKFLKKSFRQFGVADTIEWFTRRGVELKTEEDGRMFPVSNDSQTIIDCLLEEARKMGIVIRLKSRISSIRPTNSGTWLMLDSEGAEQSVDAIIIASGGSPKEAGLDWIKVLNHKIVKPLPSLFTFNMPAESVTSLMGLSSKHSVIRIEGSKLRSEGPVLITHWGMSGPGILKLSAFGARELAELDYHFFVRINWIGLESEEEVRQWLLSERESSGNKQVGNINCPGIPARLWSHLLEKKEIDTSKSIGNLNRKELNRIVDVLFNDRYEVDGKTTFKEEFVTCGGVSLEDISPETMQSRKCRGLYFSGEVMDIDGVTGGFNFQAAWTTGYIAGKLSD